VPTSPSKTRRTLSPTFNTTGLASAAAALYAGVVMIVNAVNHHGVINPQVIVAAVAAAAFLYARFRVTPIADPKDGNGTPLAPVTGPGVVVTSIPNKPGPQGGPTA